MDDAIIQAMLEFLLIGLGFYIGIGCWFLRKITKEKRLMGTIGFCSRPIRVDEPLASLDSEIRRISKVVESKVKEGFEIHTFSMGWNINPRDPSCGFFVISIT